jgi:hypothetical protein
VEWIERWDRGAWEYTNGSLSQIWTVTIKFEKKTYKKIFLGDDHSDKWKDR